MLKRLIQNSNKSTFESRHQIQIRNSQNRVSQLQDCHNAEPDEETSVSSDGRNEVEPVLALLRRVLHHRRAREENVENRNVPLKSVVGSIQSCKQSFRQSYLLDRSLAGEDDVVQNGFVDSLTSPKLIKNLICPDLRFRLDRAQAAEIGHPEVLLVANSELLSRNRRLVNDSVAI